MQKEYTGIVMRRLYLSFVVIGLVCVSIIGTWVYLRYIRSTGAPTVTDTVKRGTLSDVIKSRGEVTAQHDLRLGFAVAGRVSRVPVSEGSTVKAGTVLMQLDATASLAKLAQLRANLAKLQAGATSTDIAVSQAAVDAARDAMINSIQNAYTASDDAVRNQIDTFIIGPRSAQPRIDTALTADEALKAEIVQKRVDIEALLVAWNSSVTGVTLASDLQPSISEARANLDQVKFFLDRATFMINSAFVSQTLPQATLDAYKAAASTARTGVVNAISDLSTAESSLRTAENELALKEAPARPEDVAATQAQIDAAQQDVANATLRAPVDGRVVKLVIRQGEQYTLGGDAVLLNSPDLKIISDISELNIGRIPVDAHSTVRIALDAFPGTSFTGTLLSVDPQEIDKEGDKYYRINVGFDTPPPDVRSGMSADLDIILETKAGVLFIPEYLVRTQNGQSTVTVVTDGTAVARPVQVGISDGENIEVISGLNEGDVVAVPAD